MRPNRFLRLAAVFGLIVMVTAAMWPGTVAKYAAQAEVAAAARVAKWDTDIVPSREEDSPWLSFWYNQAEPDDNSAQATMTQPPAAGADEALYDRPFMFFKDPGDSYSFEFKLDNQSEVAAVYHLRAILPNTPDGKGVQPLMTVACSCPSAVHTVSGNSILIPCQDACTATVTLTPGAPDEEGYQSFTGLQIIADIEQVD